MLQFFRDHWKAFAIGLAVLTAVVVCVFFPPAAVAGGIAALAATPAFAALGSGAVAAATTVVALAAAAVTAAAGGLVDLLSKGVAGLVSRFRSRHSDRGDSLEEEYGDDVSMGSSLRGLGTQLGVQQSKSSRDEEVDGQPHSFTPLFKDAGLRVEESDAEQSDHEEQHTGTFGRS